MEINTNPKASSTRYGVAKFDSVDFNVRNGFVELNSEAIADIVGAMVTGNTETGITVTYQDGDNTLDFELSTEWLQDLVGAMFTGNTETGITVAYEDSDGTIDFTVAYGTEPGAVATSTSGQAGSADTASRSDHNHDLGTHTHADATVGGQLDHGTAMTGLGDDVHTIYLLADGTREITGSTHFSNNKSLGWDNAAGVIQEVLLLDSTNDFNVETPAKLVLNSNAVNNTVSVRVAAALDDILGYWNGSAWAVYNGAGEAAPGCSITTTNIKRGIGMRFLAVNIPKGSVINTSYITFTCKVANAEVVVNFRLCAELTGTPATFSTIANYQARRGTACGGANDSQHSNTINWDGVIAWVAETTYNSPSLNSAIQEAVDSNAMTNIAIFWDDHDARGDQVNTHLRSCYSYNDDPAKAPLLYIDYTPPGVSLQVSDVEKVRVSSDNIQLKEHLQLLSTDTDGTVTGQIWYDTSENKLKFKTASGVETITSS